MDNEIRLPVVETKTQKFKTSFLDFLFKLRLLLMRTYQHRKRLYFVFCVEFILFSFFGAIFSRFYPFGVNLFFSIKNELFCVFFVCFFVVSLFSGITVFGVALSVILNAFFSTFIGVYRYMFLSNGNIDNAFKVILTLFSLSLCAFLIILISAEIFIVSKTVLSRKTTFFKFNELICYFAFSAFSSLSLYYISAFLLKYI